jgi:ABC-2 type transport system permease protein
MTTPETRFSVGTFAPDPRPAKPAGMIAASAALELRIVLRNGEQLLLALVLPLAALIGGTLITVVDMPEPRIDTVTPGVLALAVLSSAFTSQAIVTAFDRRYGLLKRLAAAGMSRVQLLAGKAAASLAVVVGQCMVLGAVALAMGWSPAGGAAGAILLVVLGTATFLGLGLLLGGTVRAELALGLANLGWLMFVVVGGVLIPLDSAPGWLRTVGELTPAGALSQSLRAVLQHGVAPDPLWLGILAAWCVLGWLAAVRWFRWQ